MNNEVIQIGQIFKANELNNTGVKNEENKIRFANPQKDRKMAKNSRERVKSKQEFSTQKGSSTERVQMTPKEFLANFEEEKSDRKRNNFSVEKVLLTSESNRQHSTERVIPNQTSKRPEKSSSVSNLFAAFKDNRPTSNFEIPTSKSKGSLDINKEALTRLKQQRSVSNIRPGPVKKMYRDKSVGEFLRANQPFLTSPEPEIIRNGSLNAFHNERRDSGSPNLIFSRASSLGCLDYAQSATPNIFYDDIDPQEFNEKDQGEEEDLKQEKKDNEVKKDKTVPKLSEIAEALLLPWRAKSPNEEMVDLGVELNSKTRHFAKSIIKNSNLGLRSSTPQGTSSLGHSRNSSASSKNLHVINLKRTRGNGHYSQRSEVLGYEQMEKLKAIQNWAEKIPQTCFTVRTSRSNSRERKDIYDKEDKLFTFRKRESASHSPKELVSVEKNNKIRFSDLEEGSEKLSEFNGKIKDVEKEKQSTQIKVIEESESKVSRVTKPEHNEHHNEKILSNEEPNSNKGNFLKDQNSTEKLKKSNNSKENQEINNPNEKVHTEEFEDLLKVQSCENIEELFDTNQEESIIRQYQLNFPQPRDFRMEAFPVENTEQITEPEEIMMTENRETHLENLFKIAEEKILQKAIQENLSLDVAMTQYLSELQFYLNGASESPNYTELSQREFYTNENLSFSDYNYTRMNSSPGLPTLERDNSLKKSQTIPREQNVNLDNENKDSTPRQSIEDGAKLFSQNLANRIQEINTAQEKENFELAVQLMYKLLEDIEVYERSEEELENPTESSRQRHKDSFRKRKIQIGNKLGAQLYKLSRYDEALEELNKVRNIDAYNIQALYKIHETHVKLGNKKEARIILKIIKESMLSPSPEEKVTQKESVQENEREKENEKEKEKEKEVYQSQTQTKMNQIDTILEVDESGDSESDRE